MDIYEIARLEKLIEIRDADPWPIPASGLTNTQQEKVASHALRYGHPISEVEQAVEINEVAFRAIVGKDPSRMDYWENTLVDFLNKLDCVALAEKLNKSGPKAVFIDRGELKFGGKHPNLKSLDLKVEFKNGAILYVIHKYTKDEGGAQNNQFKDAKDTMREHLAPDGIRRIYLAAVLDGEYYSKVRAKSKHTRLEEAKVAHPSVIVCTYKKFEESTKAIWNS